MPLHAAWTDAQERAGSSQICIASGNPSPGNKQQSHRGPGDACCLFSPSFISPTRVRSNTVFFLNRFKHLKYFTEVVKKELLSVLYPGKWPPGEVADKRCSGEKVQHETSQRVPHQGNRRPWWSTWSTQFTAERNATESQEGLHGGNQWQQGEAEGLPHSLRDVSVQELDPQSLYLLYSQRTKS